ncbi:RsmE family RNA methyltransferase [Ligilactobacillus ceti]|uniref:Ribosomal RNA small subunit methyltransferase E n=1 Tax=Ligilactobacillus ceti DSM 22408 TaxID=1122146 RepID=A0A0R2KHC7_9LACO|nr:RsmE family RNA methyltransferase [Ligilactobacillus ceti]KRN88760.1 hypothetical protein IV53_GL000728 [Ligilactobacillus ceti DSM 22408]
MQRYFSDEQTLQLKQTITLPADLYKHAITVMRMREGSEFELVTQDQQVNIMTLTAVTKKSAQAQVTEIFTHQVELPVEVTIACGLPKSDKKTDLIVEKGTELGATHFIFFTSDYSQGKWDEKKQIKKLERLNKKALSAAEQSHRVVVPDVKYVKKLADLDVSAYQARVVAYEESAKAGEVSNLVQVLSHLQGKQTPPQQMIALFGPEGGISPQEISTLEANDFTLCGLGPRIMRAETAPLAFLATTMYALELAQQTPKD